MVKANQLVKKVAHLKKYNLPTPKAVILSQLSYRNVVDDVANSVVEQGHNVVFEGSKNIIIDDNRLYVIVDDNLGDGFMFLFDSILLENMDSKEITQLDAIQYFMEKHKIDDLFELSRRLSYPVQKLKDVCAHEKFVDRELASKLAPTFGKSMQWFENLQGYIPKKLITDEEVQQYLAQKK